MSATRRAQFYQNLAWPHDTKAKPTIGADKQTSQHRGCGTAATGATGTDVAVDRLDVIANFQPCNVQTCKLSYPVTATFFLSLKCESAKQQH